MIQNRRSGKTTLAIGLLVLAGICQVARAGELEPPAAPSPTKTAINETDPRIPIRSGDLPLTIYQSGSYYLAENISTTGPGINIAASAVTLDLMGFSLSGGLGQGIDFSAGVNSLTVRNGTVSGWSFSGVRAPRNSLIIDVHAEGNGQVGIYAEYGSVVINSTATGNQSGFSVTGASIKNCTATFNDITGISATNSSTIDGCSARANGGNGFYVSDSSIRDSTSTFNGGDGIHVLTKASVVGNLCSANGDAGIQVNGNDNRIEANNVVDNTGPGFDVNVGGNIIIKNTASGNGQNYAQIVAGNAVGQVQAVSGTFTNTNAWANFSY